MRSFDRTTCVFPKRPMGSGAPAAPLPVVQETPGVQPGMPGQVKAAALIQLLRVWLAGFQFTPATLSGFWSAMSRVESGR